MILVEERTLEKYHLTKRMWNSRFVVRSANRNLPTIQNNCKYRRDLNGILLHISKQTMIFICSNLPGNFNLPPALTVGHIAMFFGIFPAAPRYLTFKLCSFLGALNSMQAEAIIV